MAIAAGGLLLGPVESHAVRATPWIPGRTVVVKLQPGQTTEIVFPSSVGEYANPEAQIFSILRSGSRLLVKPMSPFERTRMFVLDSSGRSFVVELQTTGESEREDDSVEIVPEVTERSPDPHNTGRKPGVRSLFKSMKLERPVPGYQMVEKKGELFYEEPKIVQMRLLRIYDGSLMAGYVVEIENISNQPIRVDPQQFKMKGMIAASVTDFFLSPSEPKDSIEAFKGHPRKTRAYVIVSKEAADR